MLMAYWICLIVGVGYTIVAFALGGLADLATGEANGDFAHSYGVDNAGHGEAMGGDSMDGGQVLFGPFSPVVIAFFLTCFGGTGIILSQSSVTPYLQIPLAAISAFVLAALLIRFFNKFLGGLQSGSDVKLYTLVGATAEVTVGIPAHGTGEIAYIAMGSRTVAPAYSESQVAIPRHATVRIARIEGNMFYVRPSVEEELKSLDGEPVTAQRDE